MIKNWAETAKFDTTSRRIADQARIILREIFYLDIQVICRYICREEYDLEPPVRNEIQNTEKPNSTDPSITMSILTQRELIKKIMIENKATLLSSGIKTENLRRLKPISKQIINKYPNR